MPANQSWPPTEIERRQFGELAEDIAFLRRGCGVVIAPFKEGYRLDGAMVLASGVRDRAKRERARREHGRAATAIAGPKVEAPPTPTPSTAPPPPPASAETRETVLGDLCKCGRPDSHQGRCWARRGWAGPGEDGTSRPKQIRSPRVPLKARIEALERDVAKLLAIAERGAR